MSTTEFVPAEVVTAVIKLEIVPGAEAYLAPVIVGHYGPNGDGEIWLEQEGHRVQIPKAHAAATLKQLKRALALADIAAKQEDSHA